METLAATVVMYGRTLRRAILLSVSNWPVAFTAFAYAAIMSVTVAVAARIGLLGGFLVTLVWAACVSSFLYLVEMIVRTSRVTWADFQKSFGAHLWDVLGVMFVSWLFWMVVAPALAGLQQGPTIVFCIQLAIFVFFNPLPELIYLGGQPLPGLLAESYRFVLENWVEWFPPTLLLAAGLAAIAAAPWPPILSWAEVGVAAFYLYFAAVFRGLLFLELSTSSRRSRAFRYRTGA